MLVRILSDLSIPWGFITTDVLMDTAIVFHALEIFAATMLAARPAYPFEFHQTFLSLRDGYHGHASLNHSVHRRWLLALHPLGLFDNVDPLASEPDGSAFTNIAWHVIIYFESQSVYRNAVWISRNEGAYDAVRQGFPVPRYGVASIYNHDIPNGKRKERLRQGFSFNQTARVTECGAAHPFAMDRK